MVEVEEVKGGGFITGCCIGICICCVVVVGTKEGDGKEEETKEEGEEETILLTPALMEGIAGVDKEEEVEEGIDILSWVNWINLTGWFKPFVNKNK